METPQTKTVIFNPALYGKIGTITEYDIVWNRSWNLIDFLGMLKEYEWLMFSLDEWFVVVSLTL